MGRDLGWGRDFVSGLASFLGGCYRGGGMQIGIHAGRFALIQATDVVARLRALVPSVAFDLMTDPAAYVSEHHAGHHSEINLFDCELIELLRQGVVDAVVQDAAEFRDYSLRDLEWFYLPWRQDDRAVLVLPAGRRLENLPRQPAVASVSRRYADWAAHCFRTERVEVTDDDTEAIMAALDHGRYDLLVISAAELQWLGLGHRIAESISVEELPPEHGQGAVVVLYRAEDPHWRVIRQLCVRGATVVVVGDDPHSLPLSACHALAQAAVCLYDQGTPAPVLSHLAFGCVASVVELAQSREATAQQLIKAACDGRAVVRVVQTPERAESECAALGEMSLPYRLLAAPGIPIASGATGILEGMRVLLTCSPRAWEAGASAVAAWGGVPVHVPLVHVSPRQDSAAWLRDLTGADWVVVTSPVAAEIMLSTLAHARHDVRSLPHLAVIGHATATALAAAGLYADVVAPRSTRLPRALSLLCESIAADATVVRVRSERAGDLVTASLRQHGCEVRDHIIYERWPVYGTELPPGEVVLFNSHDAVEAAASNWEVAELEGRCICAAGQDTQLSLSERGIPVTVSSATPDLRELVAALAAYRAEGALRSHGERVATG